MSVPLEKSKNLAYPAAISRLLLGVDRPPLPPPFPDMPGSGDQFSLGLSPHLTARQHCYPAYSTVINQMSSFPQRLPTPPDKVPPGPTRGLYVIGLTHLGIDAPFCPGYLNNAIHTS